MSGKWRSIHPAVPSRVLVLFCFCFKTTPQEHGGKRTANMPGRVREHTAQLRQYFFNDCVQRRVCDVCGAVVPLPLRVRVDGWAVSDKLVVPLGLRVKNCDVIILERTSAYMAEVASYRLEMATHRGCRVPVTQVDGMTPIGVLTVTKRQWRSFILYIYIYILAHDAMCAGKSNSGMIRTPRSPPCATTA